MALMQDNVAKLSSGIHFVSGIDTDAGKTVCTGWLARELLRCGRRSHFQFLKPPHGHNGFFPDASRGRFLNPKMILVLIRNM